MHKGNGGSRECFFSETIEEAARCSKNAVAFRQCVAVDGTAQPARKLAEVFVAAETQIRDAQWVSGRAAERVRVPLKREPGRGLNQ